MSSYSSDFGGGGYADFLEYMKLKNANIKLQLEERYDQTGKPQIFAGCIVGIDGRTVVLDALLKKLIYEHGGIYEYLDSRKFTHLIADNIALGNQKWRRILSGYKPPYRIVHSKWVTDSVKEGRRLNEANYMPAALAEHWKIDNNALITGLIYKKPKQGGAANEASAPTPAPPLSDDQRESEMVDGPEDESTPEVIERVDDRMEEVDDLEQEIGSESSEKKSTPSNPERQPPPPPPPPQPDSPERPSPSSTQPISPPNSTTPPAPNRRPPARGGVRDINPTRENPNFVRDYFAKSRLHFIGRWKENISVKHKFSPLTQHMQIPVHWILHGAPPQTRWHPAVRYLHVDFDSFFVAVGVKMSTEAIPDPEALPIAIAHGKGNDNLTNSTSEIASCNYKAREFGITKGMYVGAAVQKCPQLKILSYHLDEIARCSTKLMAILSLVTNRVSPTSCDEAYLQLVDEDQSVAGEGGGGGGGGGTTTHTDASRADLLPSPERRRAESRNRSTYYGGTEHAVYIAAWIRQKVLSATDCTVSIGIGDSAFLAKMASKEAKPPNGIGIWAIPLPNVSKKPSKGRGERRQSVEHWPESERIPSGDPPEADPAERFAEYVKACTKSVSRNECPRNWVCEESRDLNHRLKLLREYFQNVDLSNLHGVGVRTSQQLMEMGLRTCRDLIDNKKVVLKTLKQQFGDQRGESIFLLAHGIDNRSATSGGGVGGGSDQISVTVNWGVRLFSQDDVDDFFRQLGEEAFGRYSNTSVEPQTLNLKLLIRAPDHPKIPIKFGGCGVCIEFNESSNSRITLKTPKDITTQALNLFHHLKKENFEIDDIRGITITLGKFQNLDQHQSRLKSFLQRADAKHDDDERGGGGIRAQKPNRQQMMVERESHLSDETVKPPERELEEASSKKKIIMRGLLDNFLVNSAESASAANHREEPPLPPRKMKSKEETKPAGPLDQFLKAGSNYASDVIDQPPLARPNSVAMTRKRKAEKISQQPPKRSNALLQFIHSAHVQRSEEGRAVLTIIDSSSDEERRGGGGDGGHPHVREKRESEGHHHHTRAERDHQEGAAREDSQRRPGKTDFEIPRTGQPAEKRGEPIVLISDDEAQAVVASENETERELSDTEPLDEDEIDDRADEAPEIAPLERMVDETDIEDEEYSPQPSPEAQPPQPSPQPSPQKSSDLTKFLRANVIEISSDPSIYSECSQARKESRELPGGAADHQKRLMRLERKLIHTMQTDPFRYLKLLKKRERLCDPAT